MKDENDHLMNYSHLFIVKLLDISNFNVSL